MRRTRLWLAALVLLGAGGLAEAQDRARAGARKGKVVRIERARHHTAPRLCTPVGMDGTAHCWGVAPRAGETAQILDDVGWKASVEVVAVQPVADACGSPTQWQVSSRMRSGGLDRINSHAAVMVFDWPASTRGRATGQGGYGYHGHGFAAPGGRNGEFVLNAVDGDGDGQPDLVYTYYQCDALRASTGHHAGGHYCFVTYARQGSEYRELRVDHVRTCH
jgi:hypothetical protein